ncbi:MAG: choice-of-anchor D domain-containing protein [Terriglobales bacterium]
MNNKRSIAMLCLASAALLLCSFPLAAQDAVNHPTAFGISAPLGELSKLPQPLSFGFHEANPVRRVAKRPGESVVDQVEQNYFNGPQASYTIGADFLGVGNGYPNYSVPDAPPDTTMAVGDTQIVQWVNTSYIVCSKTSPYTCGAAVEGNALWASLKGDPLCAQQNDGDIIAQWDVTAHRWLLTQNVFASPYAVCVAISTSNDANGTYYLYEFAIPGNGFPDYPKWGIWPTNYGQSQNNFGPNGSGFMGPLACVYNRTKLLAGDPTAEQICHQYTSSEDSLLPADQDSATNPPTGQDQFFIGSVGDVDTSHLSLYSAHINNPANWSQGATFTGDGNSQLLPIATFTPACNGQYGGDCVPQKSITDKNDSLGDRLMYRFAYWNDGSSGTQHWMVNFDVTASSNNQGGVRWMEITAPPAVAVPSTLSVFQQGTWAPDGNWRWMGSIARDKAGDMLLGYSESCGNTCPGGSAMFPSIYVAGRTVGDTLGTLEPELQVVAGAGSQPDTSNRWGDYSSMRIDQDGCTFWYTQEYYKVTSTFDWSTQVGSFSFAGCSGGGGGTTLTLTPTSLKWGKIVVGTTAAGKKKVVVTNTGTSTLNISTIGISGDYALVAVKQTKKITPCVNGSAVAPGATCEIKVSFSPTQTGVRTGSVSFTDNASGSPQSVALTGTGK